MPLKSMTSLLEILADFGKALDQILLCIRVVSKKNCYKNTVYTNANDNLLLKIKGFDNDVIRCFRKCCTCCLWCLEKFMKFVNRNIYIMTAIKGIIIF